MTLLDVLDGSLWIFWAHTNYTENGSTTTHWFWMNFSRREFWSIWHPFAQKMVTSCHFLEFRQIARIWEFQEVILPIRWLHLLDFMRTEVRGGCETSRAKDSPMYLKFVCSQCKWVCLKNRVHQNPMVYHGLWWFWNTPFPDIAHFACTVSLHGICWTLSKFFSRGGPHAVEYYQIDVIIYI